MATDFSPKQEQFLSAYERLVDGLFRHCYLRILHRDEAKNCTERCFQRVWAYIEEEPEFPSDDRLQSLLYRLANGFIMEYRRSEPKRQREVDLSDELAFVLRALEEAERDVIIMNYIDQMDERQIASVLRMEHHAVSDALQRAVRRLHSLPLT